MLERQLQSRGIKVDKSFGAGIPQVYCNPFQLEQVFINLATNARDAIEMTKRGSGYLKISARPVDAEMLEIRFEDNGVGMTREDLTQGLGTIARSGTKNFVSQLSGDAKKDSNLIGQFGVGFYSSFMVASRVEVVSRKAGEELAWRWSSYGTTGFDIEPSERVVAGTTVLLHFNEEGSQYANSWRLQQIVKKYSNHIAFPIFLTYNKSEWNETEKKSIPTRTTERSVAPPQERTQGRGL